MLKSLEFSGKTPDDAVAKALAQLGLERDDISVEIVNRGKSGFLGLGVVDAVVKVSFEEPDNELTQEPVSVPTEREPAPTEEKAVKDSLSVPVEDSKEDAMPEQTADVSMEPQDELLRATGAKAEATEKFLSGLLEHMGVTAEISISPRQGGGLNVDLSGNGIGAVIGRRGETLDAIQHLTNYVVNRGSDKRSHINVDAENYRAKREESLVRLAEKMAGKAIKYRRNMALEPMNSYERHVIHAALQDFEGVTTSSTGVEPNRRVVVVYVPTEKKKEDRDYQEWC